MLTAPWGNFALVVGAASGALTGLLFVAVSINIQKLVEQPALRAATAQTLVLFVLPLLFAILLVIPGQARWVFGVELTSLGVLTAIAMITIGRHKHTDDNTEQSRLVDHTSPNTLTSLLITVAGVSVLAHTGGGLYWLVPGSVIAVAGGVANTWLLLTRLPA